MGRVFLPYTLTKERIVSKVSKIDKDEKTDYFTAKITDKISHFHVQVVENGIIAQAEKYSEIGLNIEEAFKMTFDEMEILEIKTSIITETYMIIEVKSRI